MKKDHILHEILNAQALNLLLEVPTSLLPCSEVDLHNMSSHCSEQSNLVVNNMRRQLTTLKEDNVSILLAIKLQLVFDGAMNNLDEVDIPAEKKYQESLSLWQYTHHQADSSQTKPQQ